MSSRLVLLPDPAANQPPAILVQGECGLVTGNPQNHDLLFQEDVERIVPLSADSVLHALPVGCRDL